MELYEATMNIVEAIIAIMVSPPITHSLEHADAPYMLRAHVGY